MTLRRVMLFLIISVLFFGMVGGVAIVAAAENSFNPGAGTDPDFLSPSWQPTKYTNSYSDPDFYNSNWSAISLYKPLADPNFNLASWKVPTYTPVADANFLYSNWSVKAPVLFRYTGIDTTRFDSYNLDPFASTSDLQSQGWTIQGDFWQ